jgi:hypothetical protein
VQASSPGEIFPEILDAHQTLNPQWNSLLFSERKMVLCKIVSFDALPSPRSGMVTHSSSKTAEFETLLE